MGFTTSIFLFAFFPMCLLAYILCDRLSLLKKAGAFLNKIRAKDILLILFSLAFYMWACFDDVFRLCLYILLIYLAARWIEASRKKRLYINIYKEGQNDGSQTNKKLYLWGTLRKESVPRIYIWLLFGLWCHNPMLAITVDSRFPFAVSPECCSCPCFSNCVVSLTLRKRSHRKIVSHSDSHSVVIGKTKSRHTETSKISGSFALASK